MSNIPTTTLAEISTKKTQNDQHTSLHPNKEQAFLKSLVKSSHRRQFPDKAEAEQFLEDLFGFLFVVRPQSDTQLLAHKWEHLKTTFAALLFSVFKNEEAAKSNAAAFFEALPALYQLLLKDAEAVLQSDPAAQSIEEVLAAYPGFFATAVYRFSHQLWQQEVSILPRFFAEYAHSKTGIDIHPAARIGESFAIDHGTGIVIGETALIGNRVKIYQGVTLGALSVSKEYASTKRHPTIEDEVVIYSGATILGGNTVIGKGSIIGGNVWLTYSVPADSVVYHKSEIKVKGKDPFPEPLNFVI